MSSDRPVSTGPGIPKVVTEIPEVVTVVFVLIVGRHVCSTALWSP